MQWKFSLTVLIAVAAFFGFRILFDDGIVGQTKKPLRAPVFAVKGCFCHDEARPDVRVWISGPESLAAGTRAVYRISVAKDSSIAAGFDVAAFFGDLGVYDTIQTQLMRIDPNNPIDSLELTHTDPQLANGHDTISWSFYYRAPMTSGVVDTIYANGNSVDLSQDPSGDAWNYAQNFLVRVTGSTTVAEARPGGSFALLQNYPNPFNPSTRIRYELPVAGNVELRVYDIAGREVATLVNESQAAGAHEVVFDASNLRALASGMYVYRLTMRPADGSAAQQQVAARKMVLVK